MSGVGPDEAIKLRGEEVELRFMLAATQRGLIVSKPFGDSRKYDFVADCDNRLWRVQIKSTSHLSPRTGYWVVNTRSGGPNNHVRYTAWDIDFVVAYISPLDMWYVIPVSAVENTSSVWLAGANPSNGRFEAFKEAWHLLKPHDQTTPSPAAAGLSGASHPPAANAL